MLTVPNFVCMIYLILGIPSSMLDNGCYATETCWPLRVAGVLWGNNTIHPTEPVANYPNYAVVIHPTDCKPEFALKVLYVVAVGWSRCLIHPCDGLLFEKSSGYPRVCFTHVSRALQYDLAKINNTRKHIYGANFKLKLFTCAQSVSLGICTKFKLDILISTISAI